MEEGGIRKVTKINPHVGRYNFLAPRVPFHKRAMDASESLNNYYLFLVTIHKGITNGKV